MKKQVSILFILILTFNTLIAQELEPRSMTNVPKGLNFALAGYGYSEGNTLLDPSVPIEDLDAKLNTIIGAYVRSFSLFGMSSKVDAVLPYAMGRWDGNVQGVDTSTTRNGFGDARVRLSVNFLGSPALSMEDYSSYKQKTILGANIQAIAPTGQYDNNKLINLSSNRWTFKSQIGISQRLNKWLIEGYIGVWLYTKNTSFYTDNTLQQKPFYTFKTHLIRSFNKGRWLALDLGYGYGSTTYVDGVEKETLISSYKFGATFVMPVSRQQSIKLNLSKAIRIKRGPEYMALTIAYQYRWMR